MSGTLRLVLGDQISDGRLSSLRDLDATHDTVLFAEVRDETGYVKHHKQKIALIFAGMRGFAARLEARKPKVRYAALSVTGTTSDALHGGAAIAAASSATAVCDTQPVSFTRPRWLGAEAFG